MKKTIIIALCTLLIPVTAAIAAWDEDVFFKTEEQYKNVLVKKVLGITVIRLENGEKVRLIGLKPPEISKKRRVIEDPAFPDDAPLDKFAMTFEQAEVDPMTSVEEQALAYVNELLSNQIVRLEFDSQKKGDNYETLAYVFLKDGTLANTEILRNGYAFLQIQPPNLKYAERLRKAYREAREEKRGLQGD